MTHLVLVTLASNSLKDNAQRQRAQIRMESDQEAGDPRPEAAEAVVRMLEESEPLTTSQLDKLSCHLQVIWPQPGAAGAGCPQPFSELNPLAVKSMLTAGVTKVTIAVLGNPSGGGGRCFEVLSSTAFANFAGAVLSRVGAPCDVDVQTVTLPVEPTNEASTFLRLQSSIMDECAALAEKHRVRGAQAEQVRVVVNGIAGANSGVDALVWSAGSLGWEVAYDAGNVTKPSTPRSSPASAGAAWSRALTLTIDNTVDLAADLVRRGLSDGERDRLAKGHVDRLLGLARDSGILPYVAVAAANGPDYELLRLSRMASRLVELANQPVSFHSSTVALLERSTTERAEELGARLKALVDHWSGSDLFGGNLVHELVLHGVSHCEAVDRNVASICEPLLTHDVLDPIDVFDLGVSAWLHDWGHSGIPLGTDDVLGNAVLPDDIRQLHGPISALRIEKLEKTSWLTAVERPRIQTICAHHQGWSSITADAPTHLPDVLGENRDVRGCGGLFEDWRAFADGQLDGGPAGLNDNVVGPRLPDLGLGHNSAFARLQLLVALFRIADAADVGCHRVPVQSKQAQKERSLDEARLGILTRVPESDAPARKALLRIAEHGLGVGLREPTDDEFTRAKQHQAVLEYVEHCAEQLEYYRVHNLVRGVFLTVVGSDGGGYQIEAHVHPNTTEALERAEARVRVEVDIRRELGQVLGSGGTVKNARDLGAHITEVAKTLEKNPARPLSWQDSGEQHKVAVREVLEQRGITFVGATLAE